ncbi:hypothetical protein K458DRAFT_387346 [Lentithecium fluviatile CBS 122367]|uniref:Uncharacterized protein n=1 Tax=Lentithecium fluviatile CBS 122367 TaxID=1168545 RepID=A0A6G1J7F7_9PLEO|nr:hypothetical protein K458DRAFT_387346 [Lentithecium fluviatile CBS 122367]
MPRSTYLIIKSSTSIEIHIVNDKPYYAIVDKTPKGMPWDYPQKRTPFVYKTVDIEHFSGNIIETWSFKVESEGLLASNVVVVDWAGTREAAREKVVEVVGRDGENAGKGWKTVLLMDLGVGVKVGIVQGGDGCVWVDLVEVEVRSRVNYGYIPGGGQTFDGMGERSMGLDE